MPTGREFVEHPMIAHRVARGYHDSAETFEIDLRLQEINFPQHHTKRCTFRATPVPLGDKGSGVIHYYCLHG